MTNIMIWLSDIMWVHLTSDLFTTILPCESGDVYVSAYVSPCGRVLPKINDQIKEKIDDEG